MSDTKAGEGGSDPEEDWSRYDENECMWDELIELRDEVEALRVELAKTRAQRDGAQKALDKANRDNDELRRRLADLGMGSASLTAVRHYSRLLVDGGEGDYTWVE
jgi:chromosome segregation ATPase